ncbi:MAG TPA: heme-binding protein [Alphaproteobacteria bacterium]
MHTMSKLVAAAGAAVVVLGLGAGAQALDQKPVISLEMANMMADACVAKAAASGWRPINVAVFDDGGNLKVFKRMEGAFLGSIQIAQMKGHSSTMFPFPSRVFGELAFGKDGEPGRIPGIANIPGIASFPGGLPIMTAGGQQIGGIGVSGASADEDEMCAQAGIDAVTDMLK